MTKLRMEKKLQIAELEREASQLTDEFLVLMSFVACRETAQAALFEDSEDMQSIFTKGHMKSNLDGMPSTFSDSLFGTVCLFLFVDCSCQI